MVVPRFVDHSDNDGVSATHGNRGLRHVDRKANEKRTQERRDAQRRIRRYGDKRFRRRFKETKQRFFQLVDELAPLIDISDAGKLHAVRSSGSWVPLELRLAATLRWLAGANFQDSEDLFGLGMTTLYEGCIWPVIDALDVLYHKPFKPYDTDLLKTMAEEMQARSGWVMSGCIGAVDGMALRIAKPTKAAVKNVKHFRNRKGFFGINLQAVADARMRIVYFDLSTQGSTHASLAWKMCSLGHALDKKAFTRRVLAGWR
eukprot:jgi/Tetstr1/444656/TSEL_032504.t1